MKKFIRYQAVCRSFFFALCMGAIHTDGLAQPRYSVTRITPDPVLGAAKGFALNDAGHVVGEYCPLLTGRCQPFVFHQNRLELIDLKVPDSVYARAMLITNAGLVAGTYQTDGQSGPRQTASFLYKAGELNPFRPAWPLDRFHIRALNDQGDAFGIGYDPSEAFVYLGGELRIIKLDSATRSIDFFSSGMSLNQVGQIAGGRHEIWPKPDHTVEFVQPYVMSKTNLLRVGPKDFSNQPVSIDRITALNNHGHIVGQTNFISNSGSRIRGFQAFVVKDGAIEVLDVKKMESHATDINDQGTVVGFRHNQVLLPFVPAAGSSGDAFVWLQGKVHSLDQLAGMSIDRDTPLRINQRGQILVNSKRQAYLLTPGAQ